METGVNCLRLNCKKIPEKKNDFYIEKHKQKGIRWQWAKEKQLLGFFIKQLCEMDQSIFVLPLVVHKSMMEATADVSFQRRNPHRSDQKASKTWTEEFCERRTVGDWMKVSCLILNKLQFSGRIFKKPDLTIPILGNTIFYTIDIIRHNLNKTLETIQLVLTGKQPSLSAEQKETAADFQTFAEVNNIGFLCIQLIADLPKLRKSAR